MQTDTTVPSGARLRHAGPASISGVPGVRPKVQAGRRYWLAEWYPEPLAPKRRLFSVRRYGEQQAMEMAIKERQRHIEQQH